MNDALHLGKKRRERKRYATGFLMMIIPRERGKDIRKKRELISQVKEI